YCLCVVGVLYMICFLRNSQNKLSSMAISYFNLLLVHSIFLITVPSSIEYFATGIWKHPFAFCKFVSAFIHSIWTVHFLQYFHMKLLEFHRPLCAFLVSCIICICVICCVFSPLILLHGKKNEYDETKCFKFDSEIKDEVSYINYAIAITVILIILVMMVCYIGVLWKMSIKFKMNLLSNQEFRMQLKNGYFLIVINLCFLPHHIFRIHYLLYKDKFPPLIFYNEIFLAISSLCCLDVFPFVIKGILL
uniref:G-protein coupled receptors family 1 profile domain-containing protein n=1 Tax=Erpetoichthys calabaricus TaxID=27687 RepID=A0A8C4RP62_ERPCA